MERRSLLAGGRRIELYAASLSCKTLVYLHETRPETIDVAGMLEGKDAAVAVLPDVVWNRELSPWPASRAFRGGEDFAGKAKEYLEILTGSILPAVEAEFVTPPAHRGIAGYSLAGLFALYALCETPLFDRAASMSGSLWYDGFVPYVKRKGFERAPQRVYFSLGMQEKAARNPRLAQVEACTLEIYQFMKAYGVEAVFERHPGGHFQDVPQRMVKGVRWILQ